MGGLRLIENRKKLVLQLKSLFAKRSEGIVVGVFSTRLNPMHVMIHFMILVEKSTKVAVAHFQLVNGVFVLGEFVNKVVFFHIGLPNYETTPSLDTRIIC